MLADAVDAPPRARSAVDASAALAYRASSLYIACLMMEPAIFPFSRPAVKAKSQLHTRISLIGFDGKPLKWPDINTGQITDGVSHIIIMNIDDIACFILYFLLLFDGDSWPAGFP